MRTGGSLVLASCLTCVATLAESQHPPVFRVDTWSTDDGLPSSSFTGMAQTGDGYLWMAAGGHLVRFDGFEFRVFNTATHAILRDRVNRVSAGVADTLWIGLEDGTIISLSSGQFAELGRARRQPTAMVQDRSGALIVAGPNFQVRWTGTRFDPLQVPGAWRLAQAQPSARRDGAGDAWLIGRDGSLLRVRDGVGELAGATDSRQLVMQPSRGAVLRVRRTGPFGEVVDAEGSVLVRFRWAPLIRPILVDRHGRLWAGQRRGVNVYEPGRVEPAARIDLEDRAAPGSMLEDRAGNIWLSGLGLTRIQEIPFHTVTRRPGLQGLARQVRTLAPGPRGSMLAEVVLDEPGVYQFGGQTVTRVVAGPSTAWADSSGTVWIAPRGNRVPLVGRRDGAPDIVIPRSVAPPLLIAADPSRAGSFWFVGPGALYHADPYADAGPRIVDSIITRDHTRQLAVDDRGTVWAVLVDDAGDQTLMRWAGTEMRRWTRRDGLTGATIRAIMPDHDGSLWLGTYGGGLIRLANARFRRLAQENGLAEDVVSCILDDKAGNLWMAGNRGVHRVRRDDAIAFLEARAPRVLGVAYGRREGLADPETTGDACARSDDGRLWFPTFGGAAVVDPEHALALDSVPPRPHVLGIRTLGDTLLPPGITRLAIGQRRLAFSYTGVSLRNPADVRFEYRLDGVDDNWIFGGTGRVATYNDVGPGNHTFHVRAANAGGVWSTTDATLTFTVPPYFHETIPFYALLAILLAYGAHLVWRARTAQLRTRQAELGAMVQARTAELGRTLAIVEKQAQQLRTLDEAKSRFFANVSHEFRTPLSLIVGPVEDLRDGRAGALPDAARKRLDSILSNGRRLTTLVEQLLDVARLESGTMAMHAEVRDIVPLLRRVAESYASMAERKGIAFRVSCPVGGIHVRHDPDHLEKVIGNLLGNALKFTPAGGHVELRASVDENGLDSWAILEVEDSGPGIAEAHQPHVFERFYQVDDSARRTHEGTGIGLALARELVELHDGTVSLRSIDGAGSTFIVRLPLARGDASIAVDAPSEIAPDDSTLVPAASSPAVMPDEPATSTAGVDDDRTTVLVVEDNDELRAYIKEHLSDDYRVIEADNGRRALELAREFAPDLVVSDVMMPELDGHGLCEAIKHDPEIDFIPIILLTAKASRESRLTGLELGADDYLAKPVDMKELLVRAANLIASRRRLRERWQAENRNLPTLGVTNQAAPPDTGSAAFLKNLYAVMAEHVGDESFQADAMAASVAMSRSTLYRRVDSLLGRSPMDILWDYRLDQAALWLAETDANVSEIAYGVGFKSVPHFCARFRERFGHSPSTHRASLRQARAGER